MPFYLLYITSKTEHFSFTSGCVVQVVKLLIVRMVVIFSALNSFAQLLQSFVNNVIKCKVGFSLESWNLNVYSLLCIPW